MKKTTILTFVLSVCTLHVSGQSFAETHIISSGFGSNADNIVPKLQVIDDMLYAPGPDGIKRRTKGDGAVWEPFAMQGYNVIDFILSGNDIVAMVIPEEYMNKPDIKLHCVARLVKSSLSGNSFKDITPTEMFYQYHGESFTNLRGIVRHPMDNNTLMAMGHGGVFLSKDFGESWQPFADMLAGNPHFFLGWHPLNPDTVFFTSESNICVGIVYRSVDGGKTWTWTNPEPCSESSCHCIAFDPDDADHLLISGEYAIYESFDCGETWQTNLYDRTSSPILGYSYNIMYDTADSSNSTLFAVGHYNVGATRNVIKSTDKGKTWQRCMTYDVEDELRSGFYDATMFDGKIWIYGPDDIVYWKIDGQSGIDLPATDNAHPTEYYNLNGIRLGSRPATGIVIEKSSQSSKIIIR